MDFDGQWREDAKAKGLRQGIDLSRAFRPQYLRYFYAFKLGPRLDDIDLNLDEFASKVNSDLVGKVVNLASVRPSLCRARGYRLSIRMIRACTTPLLEMKLLLSIACDYNRAVRLIIDTIEQIHSLNRLNRGSYGRIPNK